MLGPAKPAWKNPQLLLVLALIFLCGALAGAVAMGVAFHHWPGSSRPSPSWREGGKDISLQRFKKELNLTSAQTEELELVLDDFMKYYQMLQSQMDDVRATGKTRILRVLDENQKRKFEKMLSETQQFNKQLR
jgi:hypothetical protein